MKRRGFFLAPFCFYSMAALALSSLQEQGTTNVQGDRQLSLLQTDSAPPMVVRLDMTPAMAGIRFEPFAELGAPAAHTMWPGFENVTLMAQAHDFSNVPVLLAVADDKGLWRLQPLPEQRGKALPIPEMSLIKHVVSGRGRYLVSGISSAGMPSVRALEVATGKTAAHWQAGSVEGEVSQLVRMPGSAVVAVINNSNRSAELVELNERVQVLRRRSLPGGAASIASSISGDMLVAYRQDRQWFLTLLDRAWVTRWTQPLFEAVGPGTRTLKLLSTGAAWIVAGGIQGQLFVQDLDSVGQLGKRIFDATGLLPPVDSNWHALMVNSQLVVRGASRRKSDLESGSMTEFLWMPR